MSLVAKVTDRWFTADPRALAILRMALALLVAWDAIRAARVAEMFYVADSIMLPPQPDRSYTVSLLMHIDSLAGVYAFLAVVFAAAIGLLVGWRTKAMQILVAVGVLSIHGTYYPHNGGDLLLKHLAVWTAFLPLGRVWSLDARRLGPRFEMVKNPAVLAVLVQIAAVYFFGGLHKNGPTWVNGEALHYTTHLDQHATWLGLLVRDLTPARLLETLSSYVPWAELFAGLLILSPLGAVWCRRVVLLGLGLPLHFFLWATVEVGNFQPACLVALILVVPREDVARLLRKPVVDAPSTWPPRAATALFAVLWTGEQLDAIGVSRDLPTPVAEILRVIGSSQKWAMFADVPTGENRLLVVGRTADGRVLDLLTGEAPYLGPTTRDKGHPWSVFWRKHTKRLSRTEDQRHADRMRDWAVDRWNETATANDRVEDAYSMMVIDRSPAPDEGDEAVVTARIRLERRTPQPLPSR